MTFRMPQPRAASIPRAMHKLFLVTPLALAVSSVHPGTRIARKRGT